MRTLSTGRLVDTHDDDGNPIGYEIKESPRPNCVYCSDCGTALAEVWPSKLGGYGWCARRSEVGMMPTREAALIRAQYHVVEHNDPCQC